MATMISEVYDAFCAAGTPDDKARLAAEALSADNSATKGDIQSEKKELKEEIQQIRTNIQKLEGDIQVIKWMLGFTLAFVVIIFWKQFS